MLLCGFGCHSNSHFEVGLDKYCADSRWCRGANSSSAGRLVSHEEDMSTGKMFRVQSLFHCGVTRPREEQHLISILV